MPTNIDPPRRGFIMPDDARLEQLRQACASPLAHPDVEAMRRAGAAVLRFVVDDFATLPDRRMGAYATPRATMETLLRQSPPEQGQPFDKVMAEFQRHIAPNALRPGHPRFLAFVPGAPSFPSILGDWLCAGINLFAGVWKEAPAAAQVELLVLDWFKEFLGYPAEARGVLTGGGSEANLLALVVARERLAFSDRDRAVVYVSEHRHWSVDRATRVMGTRPDLIRLLPADSVQRFSLAQLIRAVEEDMQAGRLPWVVVANAGATNTGAVDPLDELADFCKARGLWLHVDGAYGWPMVLIDRELMRGIDRADSITLDPHKWFGQTFAAGGLLVRDGKALSRTFAMLPEYMQDVAADDDEVNFADHGIALTRRFRALKIWFSIKVLGVGWFRQLVGRCCRLAELAQLLLEKTGRFEILSPHQLSIVCFRYLPRSTGPRADEALNRLNLAICEDIRRQGRLFFSTTRLRDRVALRFCFVNWRTQAADVEEAVEALRQTGDCLSASA
jgi:aromatic-L-amino-acid decarboxylase